MTEPTQWISFREKKTTTIIRTAVRETGVSRHHGGPIETIRILQHCGIEGLQLGPQFGPPYAEVSLFQSRSTHLFYKCYNN